MNCTDAKQIPIVSYLSQKGYNPINTKGNDCWYFSPFREEKTPSFKVNTKLNLWYDHGEGTGGTLIELGTRLERCSVSDFLKNLSSPGKLEVHKILPAPSYAVKAPERIIIKEVSAITDKRLLDYISKRGIDLVITNTYCKQVEFQIGEKNIRAIGFENRSGGFELRNEFFKGSSSPKDITLISNDCKSVCVFEGFMDFLSILTLKGSPISTTNHVILNSLTNIHKAVDTLKKHKDIFLFFDNDQAGAAGIKKALTFGLDITDCSGFYKEHKDINEFLIFKKKETSSLNLTVEKNNKWSLNRKY